LTTPPAAGVKTAASSLERKNPEQRGQENFNAKWIQGHQEVQCSFISFKHYFNITS